LKDSTFRNNTCSVTSWVCIKFSRCIHATKSSFPQFLALVRSDLMFFVLKQRRLFFVANKVLRMQAAKRVCFWKRRDKPPLSECTLACLLLFVICVLSTWIVTHKYQTHTHKGVLIFIHAHWYNLHIALLVSGNSLSLSLFILVSKYNICSEKEKNNNQKHKFVIIIYLFCVVKKTHKKIK
jgi:hypothetical protein